MFYIGDNSYMDEHNRDLFICSHCNNNHRGNPERYIGVVTYEHPEGKLYLTRGDRFHWNVLATSKYDAEYKVKSMFDKLCQKPFHGKLKIVNIDVKLESWN